MTVLGCLINEDDEDISKKIYKTKWNNEREINGARIQQNGIVYGTFIENIYRQSVQYTTKETNNKDTKYFL